MEADLPTRDPGIQSPGIFYSIKEKIRERVWWSGAESLDALTIGKQAGKQSVIFNLNVPIVQIPTVPLPLEIRPKVTVGFSVVEFFRVSQFY